MMDREIPNPLRNGKIIATQADLGAYLRTGGERGKADYIMGRTDLLSVAACPSKWRRGWSRKDTDETDWGSLVDCVFLTPELFEDRYAVEPDEYPCEPSKRDPRSTKLWNNNAAYCQAWKADRKGKAVIKAGKLNNARAAVERLVSDRILMRELEDARVQVFIMAEYHDRATGLVVPVKALLDIVPQGPWLADFKTAASAAQGPWPHAVFTFGYHVQAAFYTDCYRAADPKKDIQDFRHIISESEAPWEVGRRILSLELVNDGRGEYIGALERYCRCLEADFWPGYDDEAPAPFDGWTLVEKQAWMVKRQQETARSQPVKNEDDKDEDQNDVPVP